MKCNATSFSKMYEAIYIDLYRFALCMMRHPQDAEDAVSEAVIRAYENMHKLKKEEAFKSWMFTILSNVCKKKLKNPARKEERIEEHDEESRSDMGLPLDMKKAFFILTEEEKNIVSMSVFGGYNSKEIGQMYSLNANTVRSKRKRALEKMSCVLEQ